MLNVHAEIQIDRAALTIRFVSELTLKFKDYSRAMFRWRAELSAAKKFLYRLYFCLEYTGILEVQMSWVILKKTRQWIIQHDNLAARRRLSTSP